LLDDAIPDQLNNFLLPIESDAKIV
jgi:hypothetical protein